MKVALNLVFLVPGETGGMEIYARELIPRLAATPGVELVCLVNREAAVDTAAPWGNVAPMEIVPVHARSRIEWVRGEQQYVPRIASRSGADVLHSLASTGPLYGRVPRVTTVHDLLYLHVPDAHFGLRAAGMRLLVPAAARASRRVIVDASATKRDLVEHLRFAPERIDVVPLGVSPVTVAPTPAAAVRETLGLGDRQVLLSVSAKRPHKNLGRLLEALAGVPAARRPVLVIPGYPTPHEQELRERARVLGIEDDVVWPAWVSSEDLEGLYALAAGLVFPSLVEGFGLPVLEGLARGVPVATSDRSSMPEVAGDAALLFDPEDPAAIRAAIEQLLFDDEVAARLRAAGPPRAAAFTWERTAELTVASYRRALGLDPAQSTRR